MSEVEYVRVRKELSDEELRRVWEQANLSGQVVNADTMGILYRAFLEVASE